jgi:hypothetical protein
MEKNVSKRIQNDMIVAWLKDRRAYHSENLIPNDVVFGERSPPAIFPDIFIFGRSLVSHRLSMPKGVDMGKWLYAYEDGLKAASMGRDPVMTIAKSLNINERRIRTMLSGFRSHPIDEMTHVARLMAIAANRNFFDSKGEHQDDIVYMDGKAVMGVEGVIISAYGNEVPLRDNSNLLYRPLENVKKKMTPMWARAYKQYAIDEDSTRVMDMLMFTSEKGYTILDRLIQGPMSKKAYYKPKINNKVHIHPQLLVDMERMLNESDQPIPDMHALLVPEAMGNGYFTTHIGNKVSQSGRLRPKTRNRILDWIESQRHVLERGMYQ